MCLCCYFKRYKNYNCLFISNNSRQVKQNMNSKGSDFYHKSMKLWLQDNNVETYSTHSNGKSAVVAEKFVRNLENKIYKYMISISKNVYIDILNDIVDKYNNTYHRNNKNEAQ